MSADERRRQRLAYIDRMHKQGLDADPAVADQLLRGPEVWTPIPAPTLPTKAERDRLRANATRTLDGAPNASTFVADARVALRLLDWADEQDGPTPTAEEMCGWSLTLKDIRRRYSAHRDIMALAAQAERMVAAGSRLVRIDPAVMASVLYPMGLPDAPARRAPSLLAYASKQTPVPHPDESSAAFATRLGVDTAAPERVHEAELAEALDVHGVSWAEMLKMVEQEARANDRREDINGCGQAPFAGPWAICHARYPKAEVLIDQGESYPFPAGRFYWLSRFQAERAGKSRALFPAIGSRHDTPTGPAPGTARYAQRLHGGVVVRVRSGK